MVLDDRAYLVHNRLVNGRDPLKLFLAMKDLHTDGKGFGHDAVVRTIPITMPSGGHWILADIDEGDYTVNGAVQPLALVTGQIGLGVVNPLSGEVTQVPLLQTTSGLIRLLQGRALALGRLGTTDVAIVVGSGKVESADSPALLFVVSLANPLAPQVLGAVSLTGGAFQLEGTPTDVILREDSAIVAGPSSAVVVSLTDLTRPEVVGALTGVGGRLAAGFGGQILFSTTGAWNEDHPLGGLRTAALGNVALIQGTVPPRVVVGEGPRAAEAFRLKFRVIPADFEILPGKARIEYIVGQQTVAAAVNVSLPNGKGELPLLLGFPFPQLEGQLARPRLVLNQGTPRELVSAPRPWRLSPFEVTLAGDEANDPLEDENEDPPPLMAGSLAGRTGEVMAENDELLSRFVADPNAPEFTVQWSTQGGLGVFPDVVLSRDGGFEALLEGARAAGTVHRVTARTQGLVLGTSDPVDLLPGPAASVTLSIPGDHRIVPADGTTEVAVQVMARDADGNPVQDGTPVRCAVEGYGEIAESAEDPATEGGMATCRYRAGIVLNADTVTAEVDGVAEQVTVTALDLQPTLVFGADPIPPLTDVDLTLTVGSAAGDVPAEDTPVAWLTEGVVVSRDDRLHGGVARARVRFSLPGLHRVTAIVAGASKTAQVQVVSPGSLRITVSQRVLAGDITQDAVVSLPSLGGGTVDVPVKAATQVEISGGVPGQTVRLGLGEVGAPNRLPEARYRMDEIAEGSAPDSFNRHAGQVSGDVTVADEGFEPGERCYHFAGGQITIPADFPLNLSGGLQASLFVRPSSGGLLIGREGSFELTLVPAGEGYRVRLAGRFDGDEHAVESVAAIAEGEWARIDAGMLGGRMSVTVHGDENSLTLTQPIDNGTGPLVVGEGLEGDMDDLRLFHASGASPPLLQIETPNGPQEEATATFDASGSAFFTVRSSGSVPPTPNLFDSEDPFEPVFNRHNLVGLRLWVQGVLQEEHDPGIASYSKVMTALAVLLAAEIATGPSEGGPWPIVVADLFFGINPLTAGPLTARDGVIVIDHIVSRKVTAGDAFQMPFLLLAAKAKIGKSGEAKDAFRQLDKLRKANRPAINFVRWAARAAHDPVLGKRYETILEAIAKHGDEVSEATIEVLLVADRNWGKPLDHLESVLRAAKQAGDLPEAAKALKVALTANTPELLRAALSAAAGSEKMTAKAIRGIVKGLRANPPPDPARVKRVVKNFGDNGHLVWEAVEEVATIDATTGAATAGLKTVIHDLASRRCPTCHKQDAAEFVLKYARTLVSDSKKVEEFERKAVRPSTKRWLGDVVRRYDLSFRDALQRLIDIDVKRWARFPQSPKIMKREARKLQKDIVIKAGNPDVPNSPFAYDTLHWSFPKALEGQEGLIKEWMKKQFDTRYVRSRYPTPTAFDNGRAAFFKAVDNGLVQFFE